MFNNLRKLRVSVHRMHNLFLQFLVTSERVMGDFSHRLNRANDKGRSPLNEPSSGERDWKRKSIDRRNT